MLKKDKLQLILRAKQGSQIPKYNGGSSLNLEGIDFSGNPYISSNGIPVSMPSASLAQVDISNLNPLSITNPFMGVDTRSSLDRIKDNFGNFVSNKNLIGQTTGIIADGIVNITGRDITNSQGVDTAFKVADGVSNTLGKVNPVLGAAASGLTTVFKGINNIWGSKSKEFGINKSVLSQVGGSYGGSTSTITDATSKAGKKYGLFSLGARNKANKLIDKATSQQNAMTDIAQQALDQRSMVNDFAYRQNQIDLNGGYDQKYLRAAKFGMKLQDKIDFVKTRRLQNRINVDTKQVEEFKDGGIIEWKPEIVWEVESFKEGGQIEWNPEIIWDDTESFKEGGNIEQPEKYPKEYLEFKASLPDNQRNTSEDDYRTYLYWQLWGKPKNFQYTLEHPDEDGQYMYTWDKSDNSYHANSVAWKDNIGYFMKPKHHPTVKYELDWYNKGLVTEEAGKQRKMTPEEHKVWAEFKSKYILVDDGNFYKYVQKNKEGGSLGNIDAPEIEETNQKNIIPEGALHKNKHHMEHTEGLTQKGIPVVDNDGEQQAEIELDEIIFTLEVTKKLEELYKDGSDEAAIEAGKLLVKEILFNTDDRTGLIAKCEKGGKLNELS